MPDKITKSDVEQKLELLSERTGKDYQLDRWSPGDGWTRNQLLLRSEEDGSIHKITNVLSTREMYQYIRGFLGINKLLEREDEES